MKFSLIQFLRCLRRGHRWQNSKAQPGFKTCTLCGVRRRY